MKLFEDYLAENEGLVEESDRVVRLWDRPEDVFEVEIGPAEECEAYRVITAERILYRRKIRNLEVREAFLARKAVMDQPLTSNGPTLRALLLPEVKVAMTYVPLAGLHGARSYLGRLYCVSGIHPCACPFADGSPVGAESFGWLLLGVPNDIPKEGVSWNLAANLLIAVMRSTNIRALTQELAGRIITGFVDDSGWVRRIEELANKIKLTAARKPLWRLKWMVPCANREEAIMINADMPNTFEEAKKLIESSRGRATDALVSAVSAESLDTTVVSAQLFNGADVSVMDSVRHENLTQMLKRRTMERVLDTMQEKGCATNAADEVRSVLDESDRVQRILSYYASLPQMFFTLARRRADAAIEAMLACYGADAINSTDSDGETALDFAMDNDAEVAAVLRKHGASVRGIYRAGSRKMREMLRKGSGGLPDEVYRYFKDAVESGFLDINAVVDLGGAGVSSRARMTVYDPMSEESTSTMTHCYRRKTNVFLEAILQDTTGELVKLCIERGADVNMTIDFVKDMAGEWDYGRDGDMLSFVKFVKQDVPIRTPIELSELSRVDVVGKMLRKAGAKNFAMLQWNKIVKVD